MNTRSIHEVKIDDGEFKEFAAIFEKYQQALAKTPKMWDEAGKSQRSTVLAFQGIAAALLAQSALQAKRLKTLKDEAKVEKESSSYWKDMVRSSREVASNAASIAKSVLSTIGIGSIFSGLLGAGGLYGLSELAGSVGNSRRTALGLGSTIGETRAFGNSYGRIVDPGSVIGSVNSSLLDVSKRSDLYLAGLSEGDLKGKDAAQISSLLISKLKTRVDQTNPLFYGSLVKDFGYGNLGFTAQDLERIHNTPTNEIGEYASMFNRNRTKLDVSDKQAKLFQDFDVQLKNAGDQVENVFIRGISPLIPALTKFSDSVVTTLANFANKLIATGALDKFAGGIQAFADYLGTKDFQDNVKTFASDVVALGGAVHHALEALGVIPSKQFTGPQPYDLDAKPGPRPKWAQDTRSWFNDLGSLAVFGNNHWSVSDAPSANNIGNLRPVGVTHGFRRYDTLAGGIRGLAADLRYKVDRHHWDTLAQIIPRYAPKADHNDPVAYIKGLRAQGLDPEAKLDTRNNEMMARAMHAISVIEKGQKNSTSTEVILRVLNGTGGNVVVSANQLRGQAAQ